MHTPSRSFYSSPAFRSPSEVEDAELAFLRDQTFQAARSVVRVYVARGQWPDFITGSVETPRIHAW